MSREIKFRAYCKNRRMMISWEQLNEDSTRPGEYLDRVLSDANSYIPLQYTGLKDKNGREVYEGDIVRTRFGIFEAYWRTELAGWYLKRPNGHIEFLTGRVGNYHENEVIGNIYENSELLEQP